MNKTKDEFLNAYSYVRLCASIDEDQAPELVHGARFLQQAASCFVARQTVMQDLGTRLFWHKTCKPKHAL